MDRNGYVKWKIVTTYVALRKESVDRNDSDPVTDKAWALVALRKESVDRNIICDCWIKSSIGRSPQGERG